MWNYKEFVRNIHRHPDKEWINDNGTRITLTAIDYPGGLTKYDVYLHSKDLDEKKSFSYESKALDLIEDYKQRFDIYRKKKSAKPRMKSKKCKCKK